MGLSLRSARENERYLVAKKGHPLRGFFEDFSSALMGDELGREIAVIALPAIVALAADPLASLVDTAFIGQIGPVEQGAVGVSISIFNLVSKMFNLPLLNVTTSFVAEDASDKEILSDVTEVSLEPTSPTSATLLFMEGNGEQEVLNLQSKSPEKPFLPSVSSALVLGSVLGLVEALALGFLAGPILTIMGVGSKSPMRLPAVQYLAWRAIGAPAVVVALTIQGVFRGFKDTKTPLYANLWGNLVNVVLDPILMFALRFGVSGAAVATVLAQYIILGLLLWKLSQKVTLLPSHFSDLRFNHFLKSGGYLLGRTIAVLFVMTLATSMAARQGPISMAGHQICMQIWLAASLLSDSLALAGQAIIASAFAKQQYKRVKEASFRVLQIGLLFGIFMALLLGLGMPAVSRLFSADAGVLLVMSNLIPFVAATQPINSLAFVFDGLHYGASDFAYAAYSMMLLSVPSAAFLLIFPHIWGLMAVWVGLTLFMSLRLTVGIWRVGTAAGPWEFLRDNTEFDEPAA
ncbi:unnamed protein product [Sphagnum jensenii]|uniref:Protein DETOXIFICATION n=1 Tax=Sphagnum jensenii TaxID=128206 RepID=A0ABP0WPN0_9BRYO